MKLSKVALVHCRSYEMPIVDAAVQRAVELLGGMAAFVKPGDRVLIKPNMLGAYIPSKRVTTDPAVVSAVARLVLYEGATPVIGDSPGIGAFKRVAEKTRIAEVARRLGIGVVELSNPIPVPSAAESGFRKIEIASQVLEADTVINLPKLKSHGQMLLTLGVKNMFGSIVGQRKVEWHHMAGVDRDTFASLLLDIYSAVKPALTLLDGVWAMEGRGPSNGKPRLVKLIAAARDAVALDMIICHILGVSPRVFPLYRVSKARKIGETDINHIECVGENIDLFRCRNFDVPILSSVAMLPGSFDWFTKRYLVSKPVHLPDVCMECGHCERICPPKAIIRDSQKVIIDYNACIRCYCCQEACPHDAIRFHQGLLVRFLNLIHR